MYEIETSDVIFVSKIGQHNEVIKILEQVGFKEYTRTESSFTKQGFIVKSLRIEKHEDRQKCASEMIQTLL